MGWFCISLRFISLLLYDEMYASDGDASFVCWSDGFVIVVCGYGAMGREQGFWLLSLTLGERRVF